MAGSSTLARRLEGQEQAQQQGLAKAESSVLGWLNEPSTLGEVSKALPRGMDAERFLRIVITECRRNPGLLSADPWSFKLAVLNMAQLGLEPGPLGLSYLTGPFRNRKTGLKEVVPIIGYKGLKELAYRTGAVDLVDAMAVHEGEPFRIVRGSEQRLEHEEIAENAERTVVAYYAIAFPKGGGRPAFEVMWPKDVEKIRGRSRAGDDGPWKTDYEAMALKTVTRRLLNRGKVRLTPDVQEAIAEDEARELGFERPPLLGGDLMAIQDAPSAEGPGERTGEGATSEAEGGNSTAPDPAETPDPPPAGALPFEDEP